MRIAFQVAICAVLAAGVGHPAAARQPYTAHDARARDYLALSGDRGPVDAPRYDVLQGPSRDPLSTATGGPSGGLPGQN